MLVGIHPNLRSGELGMDSHNFKKILEFNRIENKILDAGQPGFWQEVANCDYFIFQWTQHDFFRQIARSILPIIETQLNIKCFPNPLSNWLYDDKIREYYLLKLHNFPVIESWIFYDVDHALEFIDKAEYPLVLKLRSGAGSEMVKLIKTKSKARKFAYLMFREGIQYRQGLPGATFDYMRRKGALRLIGKKYGEYRRSVFKRAEYDDWDWFTHKHYLLLQRFMPGNNYDTRVVIIGKQAFAFQRINFENDFRASGSGDHVYDPQKIDMQFIEIAFQVSKTFGFETMAYDFLYDADKKPTIVEISYVFGSRKGSKINNCPGYWDEKLEWHSAHTDVAHCILSNFLNNPELKRVPAESEDLKI